MKLSRFVLMSLLSGFIPQMSFSYGNQAGAKPALNVHPYANEKSVSGKIDINEDLKKKANLELDDNDVIYVILNKAGEAKGAPVAVSRITDLKGKKFPIDFKVGASDAMSGHETTFVGPFSVKIKLSRTGDAMSSPGDLVGYSSKDPIKEGAKDVKVNFSEIVEKAQSMPAMK